MSCRETRAHKARPRESSGRTRASSPSWRAAEPRVRGTLWEGGVEPRDYTWPSPPIMCTNVVSASRSAQSRATRRRHAAPRLRAHSRGRRQWQDAGSHDANCLAAGDRSSKPAVDPRRHLYQQGGQRDADASRRVDAGESSGDVGWNVSWLVQSDAAHALPRRELAAALSNHRYAGPARTDQAT